MSKFKKLYNCIRNPKMILYYLDHKGLHILNDEQYTKLMYKERLGEYPNLEKPEKFNEKLQWLKLHNRNPEYIKMVDKYEVKKYIANTIGEEYLIPTLGIYDKFEDIDFDKLPNQFVIKCTHDSGSVVICKDKTKLDINQTRKKINKCLKKNFYYACREWPYKDIKPRIIIEKYMCDESNYELKDYKIFCFNGEPRIIEVDFDRHSNHKRNMYDTDWKLQEIEMEYPRDTNKIIKRPDSLFKMLEISRKLSKNIPFLRVDLYVINEKIYFGELTFYHGAGQRIITPECYNKILGDWIDLG